MRIGIYDPYLDDLGGGEKYMMSIAECLSREHDVTVFWDKKEDINALLERFSIDLSRVNISKNIFFVKYNFFKRLISTRKYDILIILSDGSIPFSLSGKLFLHIQQPILKPNITIKTKYKLTRVSEIFCNSNFTKSFVDKEIGVNSSVLYPPVYIKNKNTVKENIILNVGRFRVKNVGNSDYKKQSVMVDVFKEMVDEGLKGWAFNLAVGLHDKDKDAFELLKKKAIGYPVNFMINKTNNELWELYSRSKIYWHASGFGEDLSLHPEFAEHFGISTVEAMGAGAVPVVINAGGQKEIIENGKNGYLWDSVQELKKITTQLTENEELIKKISKEASIRAKFFEGDRFCSELKKIIFK